MQPNLDAAIDLVETAYDLTRPAGQWLPDLFRAGEPLLDLGMGCYGMIAAGTSAQGVPLITQTGASRGRGEMPRQAIEAAIEAGPELVHEASQALLGTVSVLSETRARWPSAYEVLTRRLGCKDILSVVAVDPDGCGVHVSMPSDELICLDPRQRQYWKMLEVHLAAGHRLRRALELNGEAKGVPLTELPLDADAMVDPRRFFVSHAIGKARAASPSIRDAAQRIDKARGSLRTQDPEEALRLWQGLVRGTWSLIDWFDAEGRRFILAKRNAPRIRDPRGLTEREAQIAAYAALGETSKMIGYRFGLSQPYVSRLLRDAMRKLGVKTRAQLVERMRGVQPSKPLGS